MIKYPNAKINLGLHITEHRSDGYHNIETVFYPIGWKDALEIVPLQKGNAEYAFHSSGLEVGCVLEDNLVFKAYSLLKKKYSLPPIDIYFHKVIPYGAGLGGGSSDAACMLKLLNEWSNLCLSEKQLMDYASQLGADCAFFIHNRPMFASGKGDQLQSLNISLKGYYLVLIKPDVFVSTKEAYAKVKPHKPLFSLKEIVTQPVEFWKDRMNNDFEESVFSQYPLIGEIKQTLYREGAVYASMSGSGSSVFGFFKERPEIKNLFPDCILFEEQF